MHAESERLDYPRSWPGSCHGDNPIRDQLEGVHRRIHPCRQLTRTFSTLFTSGIDGGNQFSGLVIGDDETLIVGFDKIDDDRWPLSVHRGKVLAETPSTSANGDGPGNTSSRSSYPAQMWPWILDHLHIIDGGQRHAYVSMERFGLFELAQLDHQLITFNKEMGHSVKHKGDG